jgi:hypothetical protein
VRARNARSERSSRCSRSERPETENHDLQARVNRGERARTSAPCRQAGGHWFEPSTAHRKPLQEGTLLPNTATHASLWQGKGLPRCSLTGSVDVSAYLSLSGSAKRRPQLIVLGVRRAAAVVRLRRCASQSRHPGRGIRSESRVSLRGRRGTPPLLARRPPVRARGPSTSQTLTTADSLPVSTMAAGRRSACVLRAARHASAPVPAALLRGSVGDLRGISRR